MPLCPVRTPKRIKLGNEIAKGMEQTDARSESTQEPALSPSITVDPIDPDGDLLLRVGTALGDVQPCDFNLCPAAMRRASPIWRSMLYGPWSEAKPTQGDWLVELPEDKPEPVKTLVLIVHGTFAAIPKEISLHTLYEIIIVPDKYNLIHILGPWEPALKKWDFTSDTGSVLIMSTYVAWPLGFEDNYACRGH
ncbi:hypothetical protein N657DRAFT_280443 [Parathielavia appendiculata]|uniref:Uncharacterized protein n=1 Tax=Parathielavia appendiculata TaxID=2587402 RepID=A0AAN6U6A3_9PEZI|nr:hypothetical protein N657DRAFT_280443 [Parathielavia appendiculata]